MTTISLSKSIMDPTGIPTWYFTHVKTWSLTEKYLIFSIDNYKYQINQDFVVAIVESL